MHFLGILIGMALLLVARAVIILPITSLWYCFDDTLARTVGNLGLGDVPFWVIFLITIIISLLVGGSDD